VLEAAAPHLGERHVVFDVGSVKLEPVRFMQESLGLGVPWVGTHPLFGPVSLALGERPLTVVVCPNRTHPDASTSVARLLTAAGCRIVERSPDDHDREMARTHALAYLIAKGVVDAGLSLDSDIAPPSARAIARTIESARADSGHLLSTLHRDNPFAAEVRTRFLEALAEADRSLSAPRADEAGPPEQAAPEPRLPDLGDRSPELREVRDLIDDVDREMIALLARRVHLAQRARRAKCALGHGVRDPHREQDLLERRRERARELDLPESHVARVFAAILSLSRDVQQAEPPEDA
jgi:prephenate dehydrogenase